MAGACAQGQLEDGVSLQGVGLYACQLLCALAHVRACRVIHADLKPDNILVSANKARVKLCDLGSAMFVDGVETTPYLVSRYYRAPEIILGLPYGGRRHHPAFCSPLFQLPMHAGSSQPLLKHSLSHFSAPEICCYLSQVSSFRVLLVPCSSDPKNTADSRLSVNIL